jgi:iron complex transport system substrate-binding protein
MGDPRLSRFRLLPIVILASWAGLSCDRPTSSPTSSAQPPKIASLVPAATDMLLAMNAGDHLVAVSNYETSPQVKTLPRVGDYQTTDWETLARLRPDAMIMQIAPDHLPPGLQQRADELGIKLVNVKINRLDDVFTAMLQLGDAAGEPQKARQAEQKLRHDLDDLKQRCAKHPPISTLLVRDENGRDVIGPDNYLDDLLKIVNATNAAAPLGAPYPTIDREKLVALAPQAVVVLLPAARPETLDVSNRFWASMTQIPAVKENRVRTITENYALLPGARLADLARDIARCIRPDDTAPATTAPQEHAR